jgi:transcriptional regulator GlxA family with amidase domain
VVAEGPGPLEGDNGITFVPNKTFAEVPHPYAILVPGGGIPTLRAMSNEAIRAYIKSAAETAEVVSSVCTGALLLASVGLLKGRQATTHWAYRGILESFGATYNRKRWVEDGKFIMAAGVSAGIDTALKLVARLTNEATVREVQLWLDYDPQPPFGGIDYDHLPLMAKGMRGALSLITPFVTAKPKRLTAQDR